MKKTAIIATLALAFAAASFAGAQEACKASEACCGIQAEKAVKKEIDAKLFIDVKGKRIFTCCKECLEKIKANPEKFVKDIEAGGVKFDQLENCQYFIEKTEGSGNWDFGKLKKIVTPVDMTLKDTDGDNTAKIDGDNTKKIDGGNMKKIVTLDTPKIVGKDSPKVNDPVEKPHLPAPGQ